MAKRKKEPEPQMRGWYVPVRVEMSGSAYVEARDAAEARRLADDGEFDHVDLAERGDVWNVEVKGTPELCE